MHSMAKHTLPFKIRFYQSLLDVLHLFELESHAVLHKYTPLSLKIDIATRIRDPLTLYPRVSVRETCFS